MVKGEASLSLSMESKNNKIYIFSAPSGAGKTTIVRAVKQHFDHMGFSVSATTRSPRVNEQDGVDYYFLSQKEFQDKIEADAFLEWEEVYQGLFYGTLKSEVDRIRSGGQHVLFDVDVQGGINIKKYYGEEAISFFIQPPSVEVLRQRLESRGTNSEEDIQRRCDKAAYEMQFAPEFDHVILNDVLETAIAEVFAIIENSASHSRIVESQD